MLEVLTVDDFRPRLNEVFVLSVPESEQTLDLALTGVEELGEGRSGPQRAGFALTFHVPDGIYVPQQIYNLRHETMGALAIFLVPVRPDARGMRVEAVFN